jgi:uncharacterized protein (DUF1778 family)
MVLPDVSIARPRMGTPRKQKSGGARLVESGRHPVQLGITSEQRDVLRKAAELDGRPLTQFMIFHGLAAAKKIISKGA